MSIEFNKVTKFSQILAIVLFVGVYFLGFYLGGRVQALKVLGIKTNEANFVCDNNKNIRAIFYQQGVQIFPKGEGSHYLLQTISASGARYALSDESLVFWNKGDGAFIMRQDKVDEAFKNCKIQGK